MSKTVIQVNNLSKLYRLGEVGTGTISHDLNRWWARVRGKEDPYAVVGQTNDRTQQATSDYVWALKDINFEVKQGDVVGIIGRNGAGKSTLLKLLSRVTSPTKGDIKYKGRIASLLEVGTGMHPELTGRENIYLNGTIMGMTKAEIQRKFDEILDFAGCALYVDTPVKRYSSGMKVRLGFAVAAFLEPEILIVDEVLAVGDAEFQKKAIGKMKDVSSGDGRTVLFVSHNMGSIQELCTKAILMDCGKIKHEGNVLDTLSMYNRANADKSYLSFAVDKNKTSQILSISILNKENQVSKNSFLFKERVALDIRLNVAEIKRETFFGLTIVNRFGNPVFYDEILLNGIASNKGKNGLRIVIDIPSEFLLKGSYNVSFVIHEPGFQLLDYHKDVMNFIIEDLPIELAKYSGANYGDVYMKCKWKAVAV